MEQELRDFGLSDNEIKIYLALLRRGLMSPTEISKETGFARPYIYDVVQRLQEKGVAATILRDQKRCFTAVTPSQLVELSKQRLEALEKVTKNLDALKFTPEQNINVELQTGKFVFRTLLNDILLHLKKGDESLWYGIDDASLIEADPVIEKRLDQYLAKIVRSGITEKLIVKKGTKVIPQAKTTTYKFLPEETIGNLAFVTYADKLAIFLWGNPNYLIFIKNKGVASSYRNQFHVLWEKATSQ
ncbi:hypothetical protein HYS47_03600 [Candidatus Woesearchaeota archaeon]|nr:hypothetical protein [Candidatus Woesearchaeota archaeon]